MRGTALDDARSLTVGEYRPAQSILVRLTLHYSPKKSTILHFFEGLFCVKYIVCENQTGNNQFETNVCRARELVF